MTMLFLLWCTFKDSNLRFYREPLIKSQSDSLKEQKAIQVMVHLQGFEPGTH